MTQEYRPVPAIQTITPPLALKDSGDRGRFNTSAESNLKDMAQLADDWNNKVVDPLNIVGANINTILPNLPQVIAVGANMPSVTTVAGHITNVDTVAANIADIDAVAAVAPQVKTVGNNIAAVNTAAANIDAIIAAPGAASAAANSATEAAGSAAAAAASETSAAASATAADTSAQDAASAVAAAAASATAAAASEANTATMEAHVEEMRDNLMDGATPEAVPGSAMRRDGVGRTQVVAPEADLDVANRAWTLGSINEAISLFAEGSLKIPVQKDLQSEIPPVTEAEAGDYYVVSDMDISAPGYQGRAWYNPTEDADNYQIVIDLVRMPDGEYIILSSDGTITLSDGVKTAIGKVDTTGTVSEAIAAAVLSDASSSGLIMFSQLTAGTGTWTAPDVNGDGSDYAVEIILKGAGGGSSTSAYNTVNTTYDTMNIFSGGGEAETVIFRRTVSPGESLPYAIGAGVAGGNGNTSTCGGYTAAGGTVAVATTNMPAKGGGVNSVSAEVTRIAGQYGQLGFSTRWYDYATVYFFTATGGAGGGRNGGKPIAGGGSSVANSTPSRATNGTLGCGAGMENAMFTLSPVVSNKTGGSGYIIIKKV